MVSHVVDVRTVSRHFRPIATLALTLAILLGLSSPLVATSSSSVALGFANYAVGTATHDRPAHVVTATDLSNAVASLSTLTTTLQLVLNPGDVPGCARVALFVDHSHYRGVCVDSPNVVGGTPRLIPCLYQVLGVWERCCR